MKKSLVIGALILVVSLPAAFGFGRIEVTARPVPVYDQQRDQHWQQTQQNQRMEAQRQEQYQRDTWQRAQWQRDQDQRRQHHQQAQDYDWWLQRHPRDYDNRNAR